MSIADHFAASVRRVIDHERLSVNGAATRWRVPVKTLEAIIKRTRTPTLDTADTIARAAGFALWQMLAADFDPANPPVLRAMSQAEADLYERMRELARTLPGSKA
jgi:plasmid maintenance system antidote protein VapI